MAAIDASATHGGMESTVNMTAPNPVQNRDFSNSRDRGSHRLCLLPMPALANKILFGEMGEELLLGSARVQPQTLQSHGDTSSTSS